MINLLETYNQLLKEQLNANEAMNALDAYNNYAERNNLKEEYPKSILGSGQNGIAILLKSGKVFKLTQAPDEAWTCDSLVGKNNNYLCDIYGVFEYKDIGYIILQEKLKSIDIKKEFNDIDMTLKNLKLYQDNYGDFSFKNLFYPKKFSDNAEQNFKNNILFVQSYINIIKEAKSNGIKNLDMSDGNYGVKNGKLALFDLMDYSVKKTNLIKLK